MRHLFFFAALVMIMAGAAYGTTYYVATNGNDSWPGTSAQPWATLQHAVETIAAGDTILVKPGTYAGCRIENSGASGSPKTLAVQTSNTVVLNVPGAINRHGRILEVENYDVAVNYWAIDGFEVNGVNKTYGGIDSRSTFDKQNSHITIRNCHVHDTTPTGISSGHTHYALLENNVSHSNGEHGTYTNNSSDYGVERFNVVYSNTSCGMHHNGDKSMKGDGIMSYWLVEKNVAYLNPSGSAFNFDGMSDSKIFNNLAYNNQGSGVSLYGIDSSEGSSRDLVYNNTIVMPSNGRWAMNITKNKKLTPVGNKLKNNILYNASTSKGSVLIYASGVSGFESDYNVVVDRFSINGGKNIISLATWRTYGYDAHSLISTPADLFVDPGNSNYHLKSTSPAINAGTTLADVTDDMDGVSRPQLGAYDIGCYEYH